MDYEGLAFNDNFVIRDDLTPYYNKHLKEFMDKLNGRGCDVESSSDLEPPYYGGKPIKGIGPDGRFLTEETVNNSVNTHSIDWYYYNPDNIDEDDEDEEELEKTCINCKHCNVLAMFCRKKKKPVKKNQLCDDDSFEGV